jgi:hypothetical protein
MSWKFSFVQRFSLHGINKIGLKPFNSRGCRKSWQDEEANFQMFG